MQDILIHDAVAPGRIAQGTDVAADYAADELGPQVGPHALRAADPVIAAGPFHGLVALVDQDGDAVFMVGLELRAIEVMGIPGVLRQFADAHQVGAQVVKGGLDRGGVAFGIVGAGGLLPGLLAVLQRHHGAQGRHHGVAVGRLGDHAKVGQFPLGLLAEIPQGGPDEHVVAFGDPRHFGLVDESRGGRPGLEFLHGIRPQAIGPVFEGLPLATGAGAPQAQPPAWPMGFQGLPGPSSGQGPVRRHGHGRGDRRHAESIPQVGIEHRRAAFSIELPQAAAKQQAVQVQLGGRGGVQGRFKTQHAQVIRHNDGGLRHPRGGPQGLGPRQPVFASLGRIRLPGPLSQQHQGMGVIEARARGLPGPPPGLPSLLDAAGRHRIGGGTGQVRLFLGLGQGLVDHRLLQQGLGGNGANARHADIQVVAGGFQVIGPFHQI